MLGIVSIVNTECKVKHGNCRTSLRLGLGQCTWHECLGQQMLTYYQIFEFFPVSLVDAREDGGSKF